MRFLYALVTWIIVAVIVLVAFVYSGWYYVGADKPHWPITAHVLELTRNHAIDRRTAGLEIPPLDDPALIKLGSHHYSEMCVECHLAPGVTSTEIRQGLYPKPPDFTKHAPTPAYAFWVIKHGLKMTAMPAWGKTHDDHLIWAMVAFLQKEPGMSVTEYKALTADADANADHHHDHGMEHEHHDHAG